MVTFLIKSYLENTRVLNTQVLEFEYPSIEYRVPNKNCLLYSTRVPAKNWLLYATRLPDKM